MDGALTIAARGAGHLRRWRLAALAALALLVFCPDARAAEDEVAATWDRAHVALPRLAAGQRPVLGRLRDADVQVALSALSAGLRVPAVLLLHGCSGIGAEEESAKLFFMERGYPVFMPDSFARPGRQSNCAVRTAQTALAPGTPYLRLAEIDYALAAIAALGFVERVFLVGYSEGGLAVAAIEQSPLPLAGIVVLSWHCQGREPYVGIKAPPEVPALAVIGDNDPWYKARAGRHCGEVFGDRRRAVSLVLPGNGHEVFTSSSPASAARALDAIRTFLATN
ncbi:MAG: dienelactone hydrolase family protein [Alphaproteobacteria bacterium]|nr:dienelactone hydrolase family protein [Alphaproteobacteria bacterium]